MVPQEKCYQLPLVCSMQLLIWVKILLSVVVRETSSRESGMSRLCWKSSLLPGPVVPIACGLFADKAAQEEQLMLVLRSVLMPEQRRPSVRALMNANAQGTHLDIDCGAPNEMSHFQSS